MKMWIAILGLATGVMARYAADESANLAKQFDYDHSTPLQVEKVSSKQRGDVSVEEMTYVGADQGRVPAYLVIPAGKGPFAAVLWGHWMMPGSPCMNKTEFLDEAVALAPIGVVSLLIDSPMVRPGYKPQGDLKDSQQDIIDLRRGLDLLLARKDVDAKRVAYVGHSFHAGNGGILAGIEPRFTTLVLMAGGLDMDQFLVSKSQEAMEVKQKYSAEQLKQYLAANDGINPKHYLQGKHPPLLLQFGTHDAYMTKEDCEEYASIVSPPKEAKYYDAGHELNAAARHDRISWLQQQLGLKNVNWKAIEAVPEVK
jgi:dienelactone hydrolase